MPGAAVGNRFEGFDLNIRAAYITARNQGRFILRDTLIRYTEEMVEAGDWAAYLKKDAEAILQRLKAALRKGDDNEAREHEKALFNLLYDANHKMSRFRDILFDVVGKARLADDASPVKFRVKAAGEAAKYLGRMQEVAGWFEKLVAGPKGIYHDYQTELKLLPAGGRAYHLMGKVHLTKRELKDSSDSVLIHEWGHAVDYRLPYLNALMQEHWNIRRAGAPLQKLKQLYPRLAYRDDEVTAPDEFYDAYVGKYYGGRASEITSMHVEALVSPYRLWKILQKDPETLEVVLGGLTYGRVYP